MNYLIINEQHQLLEDQVKVLHKAGIMNYETIKVPANGWTKEQMNEIMKGLNGDVIFISPIPYMIKYLSYDAAFNQASIESSSTGGTITPGDSPVNDVYVMCNDTRKKVKMPNGSIIFTLSKEGWYLA